MLNLVSTSDKLQVVTGQAVTVDVHASWMDYDGTTVTPGSTPTAISTATTTDVVAAPASATYRNVKALYIRNRHASSTVDITVKYTNGSTPVELFKVTLDPGETLQNVEGKGFEVIGTTALGEYFIRQHADRAVFANNTNQQAIFDSVAAGAITLPVGSYTFEGVIQFKGMSGTSGNGKFSLAGAGTATIAAILYEVMGIDAAVDTLTTFAGVAEIINTQTATNLATAATATVLSLQVWGSFEVTVTGTVIPSFALTTGTAAAQTVAGSFLKIFRLGETTTVSNGPWS